MNGVNLDKSYHELIDNKHLTKDDIEKKKRQFKSIVSTIKKEVEKGNKTNWKIGVALRKADTTKPFLIEVLQYLGYSSSSINAISKKITPKNLCRTV